MVSEGSFYLSYNFECKLGWNREKEYYSNLTDGCSVTFSQFARDVFKFKIENISECIKKIFVSTKDFVQLFMDRRQFVFDFMDFLIKNHGTNNMILVVNADATGSANNTEHEEYYCSKMIAAFEEKYADLFKPEDFKFPSTVMHFEDDQGQVPCSMIFFSNSGKIEIKNILMREIKWYFTAETSYDKCFRSVDVTDATDDPAEETEDARFDILAEQIFQLYWLKKLVKNEINYLNFKNSKFSIMSSDNIQKRSKKLKVYNHDIKKLWDQTILRCSELLEGSTKTESDLFAELSPHYLIALRNEFVSGSAFHANDVSINEQISKLKLSVDESDIETDLQNESSDENQMSESTTITMNNKDYRSLQSEMVQRLKMGIFLSNDALQPFVRTQDANERVLLGFGSHQNQFKPKTTEASQLFLFPCPLKCSTVDNRQWICINCGEYFKADGFQVVCSCGTTHVTNLKLECFDPKHPKDFFPCEKHDPTTASITSSRRSSFSVVEGAQ